jgi:hypothetical protein
MRLNLVSSMIGTGQSDEPRGKLRARLSRTCISAILSARAHLEVNIQLPLNQPLQSSNSVSSS